MKTKITFLLSSLFLISQLSSGQNNAVPGGKNFYENTYGQSIGATRVGTDALVFIDYSLENDFIVPALTDQGYNVTIASSWTDFDTKIISGLYGLAVACSQNYWAVPSPSAIQTFINGGGLMVLCDWTMNSTLAGLFEASYTNQLNQSLVTFTDLTLGHGINNPMALINPGWGTYSMGVAPVGGGKVLATFPNGNAAAILGNGGRTIILGYLSDTPPADDRQQLFNNALDVLNGREIPVSDWAIYLGILLMVSFVIYRVVKAH
jgi:hypothetical protein